MTTYNIYRDNILVGTAASPAFTNTGLTNGQSYSFKVSAVNAVGEGPQSSAVIATPSGATRMFALPVTTQTVTVPGSIDHTGSTDVTTTLNNWIGTVADGSIINFGINGAIYKISSNFVLKNRNNLILEGNGYTHINNVGVPTGTGVTDMEKSTFWWSWTDTPGHHITIQNFDVTAHSPSPGTFQSQENTAFAHFMGGTYLEIANCTGTGFYGDFVTLNENPSYVWVHNNNISNAGRQNLSIMCGNNITMENNTFGNTGYCTFDIEPESGSIANTSYVTIRNNTCGTWSNSFLSVDGASSGKVVSNIVIDNNTVTGKSLLTIFGQSGSARMSNVAFTNNSSNTSAGGPVLQYKNIDGLTVTHNTQPLSSGSLVSTSSCTSAVTTPNP